MAIVTVFNQYETSLWISSTGRIFCIFEMEYFYDVSFPDWKYSRRHVEMTKTRFRKFSFKNEHKIQNKSRLLLLLAYNQCNFIFSTTICPYFCHCMVKYFLKAQLMMIFSLIFQCKSSIDRISFDWSGIFIDGSETIQWL